ncbi:MAG: preprotein translocase subunit SecG [Candidatus Thiodiazotropha sp.]|jgi:preprotein translocase subunit SecG
MQTILVVFHIFLAIGLVGLILIQHGKGADMGAAFGSGASGTVFGAKGSASFLTRLTAGLATLFFVTSMVMAYFAAQRDDGSVILEDTQPPAAEVQVQPQTDLPPMPAGSDVPAVPVEGAAQESVPQVEVPTAAAPENAEVPSAPVEAPVTEQTDAQQASEQPAEATAPEAPAEAKE